MRQLGDLCHDSAGVCDESNDAVLIDNLRFILQRIENASKKAEQSPYWRGQKPSLIAVSKTKSPLLIQRCYDAGQEKFGENYIQELVDKAEALKSKCPNIQWHFIGTVQSNKIAKLAKIDNLSCVETICSKKHSSILESAIAKHNRTLKVLVQVNTSKEKQKGGIASEMAVELAEFIRTHCPSLKFSGFMTIGSFAHNGMETSNNDFKELFEIRRTFCEFTKESEKDLELSMGMSNDFEAAIMLGSTSVRVGSAIFGPRLLNGEH
ncbi:Pyridoxal phosphate homeostasis protein [Dirofilaria immitis]